MNPIIQILNQSSSAADAAVVAAASAFVGIIWQPHWQTHSSGITIPAFEMNSAILSKTPLLDAS